MRQQLADLYSQSDDKLTVGKLHRHLIALQVHMTSIISDISPSF